jgi:hypothetical protein
VVLLIKNPSAYLSKKFDINPLSDCGIPFKLEFIPQLIMARQNQCHWLIRVHPVVQQYRIPSRVSLSSRCASSNKVTTFFPGQYKRAEFSAPGQCHRAKQGQII